MSDLIANRAENRKQVDPCYINERGEVHPGLSFFLKASIYFDLIEAGTVDVDQALRGFEHYVTRLYPIPDCPCMVEGKRRNAKRLEELYPLPIPGVVFA